MAINPFVPGVKSSEDFNNGEKYRNLIDGLTADDVNNIIEWLLYSSGKVGIYRHDIAIVAEWYSYITYIYLTIYNTDPTDYSHYVQYDESEQPIPLTADDFPFLASVPTNCQGSWSSADGMGADNIAQRVALTENGIQLYGVNLADGSVTVEELPFSEFYEIEDNVVG